jgi:NADPH:quinone reductase-like Zn-dependent oxidoreductase
LVAITTAIKRLSSQHELRVFNEGVMKAVGLSQFGGPDVLHLEDLPDPHVELGQLLIRVHAAAVNPTDTMLRSGARAELFKDVPPPYVPGMDAAGVLEEIGVGVTTDLRTGDHVMAIVIPNGSYGAYSELIAVPAESVVRVPAGATDVEASTLPMNGLTARLALDLLELDPGQTLAVTGAAGAVGGYVIQLAKSEGLRVVADASEADKQLVESLGADIVVRRGSEFLRSVREAIPEGADGLVDAALLNGLAVPAVRDRGRIATVRGYVGDPERGLTFHPAFVGTYSRERAKLDRLRQHVEEGRLTLRVARAMPAEQAADAHRMLEAGGIRGRLVLEF